MKLIDRKELCRLAFIKLRRSGDNESALEIAAQLLSNPTNIIIGLDHALVLDELIGGVFLDYCTYQGELTYCFDLKGKYIEITDVQHSKVIDEILYNK